MFDYVSRQIEEVSSRISKAAQKADRKPGSVQLIAVSKTFPVDAIMAAYRTGHRLFGENRVQELITKTHQLPEDIQWHLIGHLQTNKAGNAVKMSTMIESADSLKLINRLDRFAAENGKIQRILLEINISGEKSKFGETAESASELLSAALAAPNIQTEGLMTIAPFGVDDRELHKVFSSLRELRNNLEKEFRITLPELSMGMSSDYEIAISEGATLVRIGTAIFGKRT